MAVSLKHNFVSAKVDSVDATLVQPSNWNAEHTLTLATSSILGRSSAGTGVAQEIPVGTGVFTALGISIGSAGAFVTNTSPTFSGNVTLSSGVANGVLYLNGSKVATSGSALTFDGTNLGVGTASPTFSAGTGVHIYRTSGATLRVQDASTDFDILSFAGNANLVNRSNGALTFGTNATERMRLDASGNLGIGTSSPAATAGVTLSKTSNVAYEALLPTVASVAFGYNNSGSANAWGAATGTGFFGTPQSVPLTWTIGAVERMRIDASGNVGIGTTSFSHRLQVQVPAGAQNIFLAGQTGVSNGYQITSNGTALTYQWFNTGGEAMRLDASGNLGIGTTSPGVKLDVVGGGISGQALNATGTPALFTSTGGGVLYHNGSGVAVLRAYSNLSGGAGTLTFNASGSENMRLDASGNLGIGATPSPWGSNFKALDIGGNVGIAGFSNSMYQLANAYAENAAYRYKASTFASAYLQTTGQHQWFTAPSGTAGNVITFTQAMTLDASGNLIIGTAALATTATAGFPWIPSCAGVPTGAPTAPYTNAAAMVVDTTNNRLYVRVGTTWRFVTLT